MALSAGEHFAGYRIVRLLGAGGMGEVYLAEHPRLPKRDALKVLPVELSRDTNYRARFQREADLAAKLFHPHIVSVHDRGEYNQQLWIAMDYVDGLDAACLLARRYPDGMPLIQVLRIVRAVASALDYAHKQGLLHRDVKPANIMITQPYDNDGEQHAMLTDFGIARPVDEISGPTATNMAIGTVAYAAPEQLIGADLDGRADQYALAATTYHLLSGATLFPHSNPAVVISRQLTMAPPALSEKRPELSRLDAILRVALAKSPKERFARCSDFVSALAERASEPSSAPPRSADGPVSDEREERWPVLTNVLAVILAGALAIPLMGLIAGLIATSRHSGTTTETTHASSATPPPRPPSPTAATATAEMPPVIDVDPIDYQDSESPGYYTWAYARAPTYRQCVIFPVDPKSAIPEGVSCDVEFPPGTPEVSNGLWSGPPNAVRIVPPDGPTGVLTEGGRPTARTLLPNHRISVNGFSCTALAGGGIDCQAPTGGFRFIDGVLTTRGFR